MVIPAPAGADQGDPPGGLIWADVPTVPDWAVRLAALPAQQAAGEIQVSKAISTGSATNVVDNGKLITYTITLVNGGAETATDITILDVLPENTLIGIECGDNCQRIVEARRIREPLGGTILVTVTRQLSWTVTSLAGGGVITRQINGIVSGQADGAIFRNRAYVSYKLAGSDQSASSNDVLAEVQVGLAEFGKASLSTAPVWFSDDLGGTLSQDWGDFDQDGDLDLVLGSSLGATVYRNDNGVLTKLWSNEIIAYGVHWGDFNGDGKLDLVTVGDSVGGSTSTPGTNYLYTYNPAANNVEGRFVQLDSFPSDYQLVRVVPGDFDKDGDLDLIASTNLINAACPVVLYRNRGVDPDLFDNGPGDRKCISLAASAAIGAGDYDNDGDLDLALGLFPNSTRLFINDGSGGFQNSIPIDQDVTFLPYDFSWGDYDGDGYLDLAEAFPLRREVRIYRNLFPDGVRTRFGEATTLRTSLFLTPFALDWGDFDGDGKLDLAVADSPLKIYRYVDGRFEPGLSLPGGTLRGQLWSLRGVDLDGDGTPEISLTNRDGPSQLFETFAPMLNPALTPIPAAIPASGVTWGDVDSDGDLDLLVSAASPNLGSDAFASKLYVNVDGAFDPANRSLINGFGPHAAAFGDVNNNGILDTAIALGASDGIQLFMDGSYANPAWKSPAPQSLTNSLAWGDANDDGRLDLLAGNDGAETLYLSQGSSLAPTPSWTSATTDTTRSVVWGDFNADTWLDFAVGNFGQPNRIYINKGEGIFAPYWTASEAYSTTAIAWVDFDGDGDLDLSVGNYGQPNLIYRNSLSTFNLAWQSAEISNTNALAWADWDQDGDLDMAVGNDGQADQVYANSTRGDSVRLDWLWTSTEQYRTSGVAWGDVDGDGDPDLAISQRGNGANGIYINNYVKPAHQLENYVQAMPLPANPTYLSLVRPGHTPNANFYASPQILSGPTAPTVTVQYRLFDPDGSRNPGITDAAGDKAVRLDYEYSLDGGGAWYPATPASPVITPLLTSRLGTLNTFQWAAQADRAISDNARFRVRVTPAQAVGPIYRSATAAVSPPFRVRGTTCLWPDSPSFFYIPAQPNPGDKVSFVGNVPKASGVLTFTWDFGDGATVQRGQLTSHTFSTFNIYTVTLTVAGEPCPINRDRTITKGVLIGGTLLTHKIYLPLVQSSLSTVAASAAETIGLNEMAGPADLRGAERPDRIELAWSPVDLAGLRGYRIYRGVLATGEFVSVGEVDGGTLGFTDGWPGCGHFYFVSAVDDQGQESPSQTTFATSSCIE